MPTLPSAFTRSISNAIHGPLPLNPAKTKRLLAVLTASFQRHLDAAHPTSSTSASSASPHLIAPTSAFHASASHYANILQHPAFTALACNKHQTDALTLPAVLRRLQALLLQDGPSVYGVEACLAVLVQQLAGSAPRGLAAKILGMFRVGNHMAMLHERSAAAKDFGRLALREDRVDMLHQLAREATSDVVTVRVALTAAHLLERGPDFALRFIVSVHNHGIHGLVPAALDKSYAKCLKLVCRYLLAHPEAVDQVRPEIYHVVLRQAHRWNPKTAPFDSATLGLFRPGAPNCEKALALIQRYDKASDKSLTQTAKYRRLFIRFCFRLAQLLIQHGRLQDANFVLDFCKYTFPDELASRQSQSQKETDESDVASKVVGLLGI